MKKIVAVLGLAVGFASLSVWADNMGSMDTMTIPVAAKPTGAVTPAPKKSAKAKKAAQKKKVYVCPMGDYTGNKPGKCPKCGMDLVEKK